MPSSHLPMGDRHVPIVPSLPAQIPVSAELQQTIALILGYAEGERVPLRCSPSGILYHTSPRLTNVFHVTGVGANYAYQGSTIACSEVLVMAHPDNTGRVWVRVKTAATVNDSFPLEAGDPIGFTVDNLSELHALIVVAGEKLIVGYSL